MSPASSGPDRPEFAGAEETRERGAVERPRHDLRVVIGVGKQAGPAAVAREQQRSSRSAGQVGDRLLKQ